MWVVHFKATSKHANTRQWQRNEGGLKISSFDRYEWANEIHRQGIARLLAYRAKKNKKERKKKEVLESSNPSPTGINKRMKCGTNFIFYRLSDSEVHEWQRSRRMGSILFWAAIDMASLRRLLAKDALSWLGELVRGLGGKVPWSQFFPEANFSRNWWFCKLAFMLIF